MKPSSQPPPIRWFRVLTVLVCLVASGCSTFNRDWKSAAKQPTPPNDIQGRWEGKWLSEVNGHTGKLRCLLSRLDDTQYKARYRATYRKILRFSYDTYVTVERSNESFHFHGDTGAAWVETGPSTRPGRIHRHRSGGEAVRELVRGGTACEAFL